LDGTKDRTTVDPPRQWFSQLTKINDTPGTQLQDETVPMVMVPGSGFYPKSRTWAEHIFQLPKITSRPKNEQTHETKAPTNNLISQIVWPNTLIQLILQGASSSTYPRKQSYCRVLDSGLGPWIMILDLDFGFGFRIRPRTLDSVPGLGVWTLVSINCLSNCHQIPHRTNLPCRSSCLLSHCIGTTKLVSQSTNFDDNPGSPNSKTRRFQW
jgi:hypothetical protein